MCCSGSLETLDSAKARNKGNRHLTSRKGSSSDLDLTAVKFNLHVQVMLNWRNWHLRAHQARLLILNRVVVE
jgi:hypothetical protein